MRIIAAAALAALLAAPTARAEETKLQKADVPAPVLTAVEKKYAGAEHAGYEKEVENGKTAYEVKVKKGGQVIEVSLDAEGKILSEETAVEFASLPAAVQKAFHASQFGKWKVTKAEKIVTGEDEAKTSYEVAATHGKQAAEAVFDAAGKLVKQEKKAAGKAD